MKCEWLKCCGRWCQRPQRDEEGKGMILFVILGSKSDCLLGQLDRIFRISDSEADVKKKKARGVVGEEDECGDDAMELLERDRRRLGILSVKKEAKLSARKIHGVEEGKEKRILWCKSLFTVCQRRLGLSEDDRQIDRQTDTLIAILCTPTGHGRVSNCCVSHRHGTLNILAPACVPRPGYGLPGTHNVPYFHVSRYFSFYGDSYCSPFQQPTYRSYDIMWRTKRAQKWLKSIFVSLFFVKIELNTATWLILEIIMIHISHSWRTSPVFSLSIVSNPSKELCNYVAYYYVAIK